MKIDMSKLNPSISYDQARSLLDVLDELDDVEFTISDMAEYLNDSDVKEGYVKLTNDNHYDVLVHKLYQIKVLVTTVMDTLENHKRFLEGVAYYD